MIEVAVLAQIREANRLLLAAQDRVFPEGACPNTLAADIVSARMKLLDIIERHHR